MSMGNADRYTRAALVALGVVGCSGSGGSAPGTTSGSAASSGATSGSATSGSATSTSGGTAAAVNDAGVACGTATTLASNQMGLGGLAISGSTLIWTTCPKCLTNLQGTGDIVSLPTSGGTPTVLAPMQDNTGSIVANTTDVYWTAAVDGDIMTIPVTGGTATAVYKNVNAPTDLTIDATTIYWNANAAIVKGPIGGGTRQRVSNAPGNTFNVAVNGSGVYWVVEGGSDTLGSIASAGLDQDGGAPTTLADKQTPLWIAADATNVYWPNGGSITPSQESGIMKIAATGGTPTVLSNRNPNIPGIIAIDATNIYWVETVAGTTMGLVYEMPLSGGTPKCLAPGPEISWGLVVDSTNVYWTGIDGVVAKAPK
jgi:hypothetical protein